MKRITISLPDELQASVQREARRRRIPLSQVIRERLEVGHSGEHPRASRITFAAIGRSGQHDNARRVDAILEAEWTPTKARARSR